MDPIKIYVDGGYKPRNTVPAYGTALVTYKGEKKKEITGELPECKSSQQAEYGALIRALEYVCGQVSAHKEWKGREVVLIMDSHNTVQQVLGQFKVGPVLRPFHVRAMDLINSMKGITIKMAEIDDKEMKRIIGH